MFASTTARPSTYSIKPIFTRRFTITPGFTESWFIGRRALDGSITSLSLLHVQPGFFCDLAAINEYAICFACLATVTNLFDLNPAGINDESFKAHPDLRNALACVVLRKETDAPFRYPLQGKYSNLGQYVGSPLR